MSQSWHKPLRFAASAVLATGMVGFGFMSSASAHLATPHARTADSGTVLFSDDQAWDTLNPYQAGTVMDVEGIGPIQPSANFFETWSNGYVKAVETNNFTKVDGTHYYFDVKQKQTWGNGDPLNGLSYVMGWHIEMNPNLYLCDGYCDDISSISLSNGPHGSVTNPLQVNITLDNPSRLALDNVISQPAPFDPFIDVNSAMDGDLTNESSQTPSLPNVTNTQLGNCLNASAPTYSGCDNLSVDLGSDSRLNWLDNTFPYAGPYQVNNVSGQDIFYTVNPHYSQYMPGGVPKISHLHYTTYASTSAQIGDAANHNVDMTSDYAFDSLPTLQQYACAAGTAGGCPNGTFYTKVGGTQNPEAVTFNEDATIGHVTGFPGLGTNINNPFNGSNGKLVRLALAMAFNRVDIYIANFGMNAKTSKKYINYCAPITCSGAKNPLYSDSSITGAWDPLANSGNGAYVPGKCGTATSNGGDGQNNQTIEDAEALIEAAGYSHSNQLEFALTSSTASFRNQERPYLASCWQALADGNGSMVKVDQSNVPGYFNPCSSNGVRCNGWFEAGLIGFGGSPSDPDFWKNYLYSDFCSRDLPTGANNDCIKDNTIDNAFDDEIQATDQTQIQNDFDTIQERMVKQAYWVDTELRVDIRTWDEIHPASGWSLNSFNAADTWNVFKWS